MDKKLHNQILFTQVRVKTEKAGGSGTVIYSKQGKKGFNTYIITCQHVIEEALKVIREYDPRIGQDRKKEYRQAVKVEFFDYENIPHGHRPINNSIDGDIMAYDKKHDMALVKLRTTKEMPYIAKLFPQDKIEEISIGDDNYAVGCALLHDPILTRGMITHMGDEMNYKDYWMSSAQIIFGNSGGAVFYPYSEDFYFIGIPSAIDIAGWGTPVTHLGYFSPVTRIYQFLSEQHFEFIYDKEFTEERCEKLREDVKRVAERRFIDVEEDDEKPIDKDKPTNDDELEDIEPKP